MKHKTHQTSSDTNYWVTTTHHGSFGKSRNASIDAGLQKASEFFSSPNVTRATCACCNELLQKAKSIRVIKAKGPWLERLENRLDVGPHRSCYLGICDRTQAYYHAPETSFDLKGMPLARTERHSSYCIKFTLRRLRKWTYGHRSRNCDQKHQSFSSCKCIVCSNALKTKITHKAILFVYQVTLCSRCHGSLPHDYQKQEVGGALFALILKCHGNLSRGKANVASRPPPLPYAIIGQYFHSQTKS
jgi:hypothetical protein